VLGVLGLTGGAHLMVTSAVSIATDLGVPQLIIGISVVAIGTSLPELATSVVAATRDEADISVGNVVGSNVFNSLLVLGAVAAIAGVAVGQPAIEWDLWVMVGVTVLVWPIMWTGRQIGRLEGVLLLCMYAGYMVWLFLR
jgi:cation:H+ antiporter